MLKVKEYSSFEAFEQDEHRQDVDLVAIVNKPNGMVCADLITECIKEGFWQDKALTDGKYTGGYFWEVEDLDGRFYICLNVVRKEVA